MAHYPPQYDRIPDGTEWAPPPPKRKGRLLLVLAVAAFACFVIIACAAGVGMWSAKPTPSPTATTHKTTPDPGVRPTAAKPVETKAIIPQIRDGEYEVGADVTPGKYKTAGAEDSVIPLCSWSVKKDGHYTDSGVADGLTEQAYVTLKKGTTFKTSGCKPWIMQ